MTFETDDWLDGGDAPAVVPVRDATKREIADATAYTLTKIDALTRNGMPSRATASKRDGLRYDLPAVIEWIAEHRAAQRGGAGDTSQGAKRRLSIAQARLKEIEIEKAEGDLIAIDEVLQCIGQRYGHTRQRLLSLPTEIAGLTVDQREALADAIHNALTEISGATICGDLGVKGEDDAAGVTSADRCNE
jgi:phage terminase Nu1 subunit (DNA packaging protein)